jgi:hypothetical protein
MSQPENRPVHSKTSVVVFGAPWGTPLKAISAGATVLMFALMAGLTTAVSLPGFALGLLWGVVGGSLIVGALFVVRGYALADGRLQVRRSFWSTRIDLAGLISVRREPSATRGSLRLWGHGGLYAITGWYRNRTLGTYRMFATKLENSMVLEWPDRRVVVTPGDPERFVGCLAEITGEPRRGRIP